MPERMHTGERAAYGVHLRNPCQRQGFSFFAQRKHMRKERRMAEKIDFGELVLKGDVDAPAVRKPAKKAKADLGRLTASS